MKPSDNDAQLESLLKASAPRRDPPALAAADIEAAVHKAWRTSVDARAGRRRVVGFAMAASVALAAGILAWQIPRTPAPAAPIVATVDSVEGKVWVASGGGDTWSAMDTGQGIEAGSRLRADDGARLAFSVGEVSVRVDQASELVVESVQRLALNNGAVYLDSGDTIGVGASLEVDTPVGSARHVGTQYELRVASDELILSVREGYVELRHDGATTVGAAGDQVVRLSDGDIRRRSISPDDERWRWAESMAPEFQIAGRSLSEFLDWVARETGRALAYEDEATRREASLVVLRGSTSGLAPRQALEAVLATTGFTASDREGALVIARTR